MSERIVLAGILSLALAACGEKPEPAETSAADASAQGDILGGSISDAMLPLDTVQSQSPPRAGEGDASATDNVEVADDTVADTAE